MQFYRKNTAALLTFRAVSPRFRPKITRSPLIGARAWRESAGLATFSDIYRENRYKFVSDVPFPLHITRGSAI